MEHRNFKLSFPEKESELVALFKDIIFGDDQNEPAYERLWIVYSVVIMLMFDLYIYL